MAGALFALVPHFRKRWVDSTISSESVAVVLLRQREGTSVPLRDSVLKRIPKRYVM